MNLFIVGWHLTSEQVASALSELRQMHEIYPQLDPETIWQYDKNKSLFAASMHTSQQVAQPRRYVWQTKDQVTFYDGCMVDRTRGFKAHDAQALARHWEQLPETLEGAFVAVRLGNEPPCIELLTDFLGQHQVYYLQQGSVWLVSNSVRLLSRIGNTVAWDPLGVSLFLTIGWVGADRTLQREIRVIPGGQHWTWQQGSTQPARDTYYPLFRLSGQRQRRMSLTQHDIEQLAGTLVDICRNLAQSLGEPACALTGGRDSRLVTALLVSGEIPARYYTDGEPASTDEQIANRIAVLLDLPHLVRTKTSQHVTQAWDIASWKLVRQVDGMVSLWQIADVLRSSSQVDHLGVTLSGIGGEIARGYFSNPKHFLRSRNAEAVQHYLTQRFTRSHDGLIRSEAAELARSFLKRFVEHTISEGFSPLDVPDTFYVYERVRRWAGTNARKALPVHDLFMPLCTRPFVEAAYSLSALHRYSEPLHYELTQLLVPKLHRLPFDKKPWRSQHPYWEILNYLVRWPLRKMPHRIRSKFLMQESKTSTRAHAFDQPTWLEVKRSTLREICLDQPNSSLWSFVDRPAFEYVMSDRMTSEERFPFVECLYAIFTLFYYALS